MTRSSRAGGALLILVMILVSGCAQEADAPASEPTVPPTIVGEVNATFATYRAGVTQGDGEAVLTAISDASIEDQERIVELARTAPADEVRALPAADQLLVLIYRLETDLLEADNPFEALVDGGFAGQDRSIGDLGRIVPAGEDTVLGVVTDRTTGSETGLRWLFVLDDDGWRFDLIQAQRLISQGVASGASSNGVEVSDLVAGTVQDLSGEDAETVEALYDP